MDQELYALSVKQPWAALLASGRKTVEVRRWRTSRRGPVLIHAARVPDDRPEAWAHLPAGLLPATRLLGGIVGVGELAGCRAYHDAATFAADRALHWNDPDWFESPPLYGLVFADARPLPFRRCPGQTRFFRVEAPADLTPPPRSGEGEQEGTGLLVSVRSVAEAGAALAGGAGVIDVKEPARGPLGRADDSVTRGVIDFVAGRVPVSAARGELAETHLPATAAGLDGLTFAKWGLAGCARRAGWRLELIALRDFVGRTGTGCRPVAVAYADWERAQAPPPKQVAELAAGEGFGAFLIDTYHKDGTTLCDWLAEGEIAGLVNTCRGAGVRVALAGSLRREQVRALAGLRPDWFAVRGAACEGGDRGGTVDANRVRGLTAEIAGATAG